MKRRHNRPNLSSNEHDLSIRSMHQPRTRYARRRAGLGAAATFAMSAGIPLVLATLLKVTLFTDYDVIDLVTPLVMLGSVVALYAYLISIHLETQRLRAAQTCLRCGYDLSNIPWQPSQTNPDEQVAACPECGTRYIRRREYRIHFDDTPKRAQRPTVTPPS